MYVKITDRYIYTYSNRLTRYDSKYIKNGKVDNVSKFTIYLKHLLKEKLIKKRYVFILDTLLCNSDIFVYNYVFESIGLVNYKIINDLDILKSHLNEDNIIIMNWSSSSNYAYINNNEIICHPFNLNIVNKLNKKYILLSGDTGVSDKIKLPIYHYEHDDYVIFNYI